MLGSSDSEELIIFAKELRFSEVSSLTVAVEEVEFAELVAWEKPVLKFSEFSEFWAISIKFADLEAEEFPLELAIIF